MRPQPTIRFVAAAGNTGAGTTSPTQTVEIGVGIGSTQRQYNYKTYIQQIYKFSIDFGVSLAVLMIVYAGYKYLTSQGNQAAISDAKEIIIGALLGFAMLMLVRFILSFIGLPDLNVRPS